MSNVIKASLREKKGTGASRRLRNAGSIPAIVYGDNQEPLAITVNLNTMFHSLQKEEFHTSVLDLDLDGKVYKVLVRDFQMHPYKPQAQHIDFQIVDDKTPIRVKVPLHFVNAEISPAVKLSGGRVNQLAVSVEVLALPNSIPSSIELDLRDIVGGSILHVSDLTLPEGVTSIALKRGINPAVASASGKKK